RDRLFRPGNDPPRAPGRPVSNLCRRSLDDMTTHRWKLLAFITAGCLGLLASGCTRDPAVAKQRHLEKAQAYYAKKQYNEAIIEVKNALQIDPKFAPAVHLIGRAYAAKAWHLDAMRELGRAVELQPDNIAARVDLGRSYIKLEGWADALKEADAIA